MGWDGSCGSAKLDLGFEAEAEAATTTRRRVLDGRLGFEMGANYAVTSDVASCRMKERLVSADGSGGSYRIVGHGWRNAIIGELHMRQDSGLQHRVELVVRVQRHFDERNA